MRSTDEWIAPNDDAPIPKRVKLRILVTYEGKCHRTGHKFRPGDPIEFDHVVALCNGGEHRERNIAPILGGKPHKEKTAADVKQRAKVDRIRAKEAGLWPKSPWRLRGRPFGKRCS